MRENTLPYLDGGKTNRLAPAYSSPGAGFDDSIAPDYRVSCEFGTLSGNPAPPTIIYIWFEGDTVYTSRDILSRHIRAPAGILDGYGKRQIEEMLDKQTFPHQKEKRYIIQNQGAMLFLGKL